MTSAPILTGAMRAPRCSRGLAVFLAIGAVGPRLLAAQDALQSPSVMAADSCDGRIVSAVEVDREPPSLIAKSAPAWSRPVVQVLLQHKTTKPSAILPFLLLRQGEACTEFKVAESARLLRAQPYLADAMVRAVPDSGGTVRIEVATVDEIPLVVGLGLGRGTLSAFTYGNANILGAGMFGAVGWEEGFAYRDGLKGRYTDYHVFGRRYTFSATVERYPHGHTDAGSLGAPFLTDAQHTAWYLGVVDMNRYVSFRRPHAASLALALDRTRADAGGVLRIGGRSTGLFAGPLLSYESIRPAEGPVIIARTGYVADTSSALVDRYPAQQALWAGGVLGTRLLSFVEARGFDALVGPQDIGRGIQLATTLARGVGSGEHSTLGGADVYVGVGTPGTFLALRAIGEARTNVPPGVGRWSDAVASGRLAWYVKPSSSALYITSLEFSGAWRERIPYELALGAFPSGLRGYAGSHTAGGQRAVLRVERRWVLGRVTKFDRIGVAGFSDVGETWAGAVPFGQTSGIKQGIGFGVLVAVPPESRQLIRLDFAVPVIHDPHARYDVRLSVSTAARAFWRDPGDIAPARAATPGSGIFSWP